LPIFTTVLAEILNCHTSSQLWKNIRKMLHQSWLKLVIVSQEKMISDLRNSDYDLRKFRFASRIMSIWHSLPNWIVSANTTNTFKIDLIGFGKTRKYVRRKQKLE